MIYIPIFKFEDIEINYVKRGKGRPLVLFQGLGQGIGSWTFQLPFFKRKMLVIALDNRGVGKSSRPNYPYTMDMFIEETKNLLEFLNIKDKIHVMGISMGGMIAQSFVLKYPEMVKTVILLATSAHMDPNPLIEQYKYFMEKLDLEEAFKRRLELMFSKNFIKNVQEDQTLLDALKNKMMLENPTRLQDYINRGAAISNHDTRDSLHKISQPTLIMAGTEDQIIPFAESKFLHEKIPNSRLELFDGYGHGSLLVEDAEKTNNMIWEFIQEHLE
ncbi:MAG: alpha/beta fold hydrolase [Promethearchaeota archaeon]